MVNYSYKNKAIELTINAPDINRDNIFKFEEILKKYLIDCKDTTINIDMKNLEFIDSSAVSFGILFCTNQIKQNNYVNLYNIQPYIMRILNILGLSDLNIKNLSLVHIEE